MVITGEMRYVIVDQQSSRANEFARLRCWPDWRECLSYLTRVVMLACGYAVAAAGIESREVLERWAFNIETDKAALTPGWVARRAE